MKTTKLSSRHDSSSLTFAMLSVALDTCSCSFKMQNPVPAGTITRVRKKYRIGGTLCPLRSSLNIPLTVRTSICGCKPESYAMSRYGKISPTVNSTKSTVKLCMSCLDSGMSFKNWTISALPCLSNLNLRSGSRILIRFLLSVLYQFNQAVEFFWLCPYGYAMVME